MFALTEMTHGLSAPSLTTTGLSDIYRLIIFDCSIFVMTLNVTLTYLISPLLSRHIQQEKMAAK